MVAQGVLPPLRAWQTSRPAGASALVDQWMLSSFRPSVSLATVQGQRMKGLHL
jgi:hypothetical protein